MSKRVLSDHDKGFDAYYPGPSQKVSFTNTSAQSTAVGSGTTLIRLFATEDCYIAVGLNPTATTSALFIPAGIVEFIGIKPGQMVAAIRSSADGILHVTECA